MKRANYSTHVKQTAIEKILGSAGMSLDEVSEEMGIKKRTLYEWVNKSKNGTMSTGKRRYRKRKISFQEKYKVVRESLSIPKKDLGNWLREKGYREEQLKLWETEIEETLNLVDAEPSRQIEKELREMKKELNRKDKALAEVSALLILKKKVDLLMGREDTET